MVVGGTVEELTMASAPLERRPNFPYDPMLGGVRLREEARVP
jgi:hypothetical protein